MATGWRGVTRFPQIRPGSLGWPPVHAEVRRAGYRNATTLNCLAGRGTAFLIRGREPTTAGPSPSRAGPASSEVLQPLKPGTGAVQAGRCGWVALSAR
jgi:hypothetical protein